MKKKILLAGLTFLMLFFTLQLVAQVGINTDGSQADPSAMLDVKSAIKGFLPPRVALTSLNACSPVASPAATGLLVFNTATANNVVPGYYYWNGARWVAVATPQGLNAGEMLYWDGSAWVTIPSGTHGQQLYFCNGLPTWGGCIALMTTSGHSNITQRSVVSGGNITSDGGSPVIERGTCWSITPNPTISDNKTIDGSGTGVFTSNITGLSPSTTYYLRAYATNGVGTGYGNQDIFTTGEYSGAPVTTIPVLSACPGTSVDIPITVGGFNNIGSVSLTLHYNPSALTYAGATNTSGYPGLSCNGNEQGVVTVSTSATTGVTYPDNTVLFTMHFNYAGGSANLSWFDNGTCCQYLDGGLVVLDDTPTSSYYINGHVNENLAVGTPVFTTGATSSRCQAAESVAYTATAANSSGITYSLDALSTAAGNSIDLITGTVNFTAAWAGTSVITATATGCDGPKTSEHTVTVSPLLPVSITVSSSASTVCAGTEVTFTATSVNGGAAPVYQWKVNGSNAGTNDTSFSYIPSNGDLVTCMVNSTISCVSGNPATSDAIVLTVHPQHPVSVSIAASANPACEGIPVTFTATPVNGGPVPAYQWQVKGTDVPGATDATYAFIPDNGDHTSCVLTSNAVCPTGNPANSNTVTMNINPVLTVSVSVTASANPVCGGTSVTFSAAPVNGGTTPGYQWKVNGTPAGSNSDTFAYVPANSDKVTCILTSSALCVSGNPANSNEVTMDVALPLAVGSIGPDQTIGEDMAPAELQGVPPLNGTSPVYQMQSSSDNINFNDIEGATSLNYQPEELSQTTYYRQLQNATGVCGGPLPTNVVTITVSPVAAADISIAASPGRSMCQGGTVTFTATPVNGGTTPVYQWKVNGNNTGSNSPVHTYVPQDGDLVTCVMTSNMPFVTNNPAVSNSIIMSVTAIPDPPAVSIAAVPQGPVCAGTQVEFTATPVNGGTSPVYQWKVNGVNAGTNSAEYSYVPVNNDVVVCSLISNVPCITQNPVGSNNISMAVTPALPVSVSISASANPSCAGSSVTYTATPVNGGTSPSYQWKVNGTNAGSNNVTFAFYPAGGDMVSCTLTSNATCISGNPATSNSITATVNANNPVSVSISANPTGAVCQGTPVTFTASPTNGGSTPSYQWKVNGANVGSNSSSYSYSPLSGDAVTCVLTSNLACTSGNPATSNSIPMTVNPNLAVSVTIVASANPVVPATSVTFTATAINGGATPSYQWKVNGTNVGTNSPVYTYTPSNNDNIVCVVLSSITTCVSGNPATSNNILMVVAYGIPCPGVPSVSYGGKTYNTVQVGVQCWLKENLDIGTMLPHATVSTNNSTIEKYCYNDLTSNCDVYGGTYLWNELMQYVSTEGSQGICPAGWHVPTDAEFTTLSTYLGGDAVAGGKMKEAGTTHFISPNTGATNESGFTALPCGYLYNFANFSNMTQYGYFYTSTTSTANALWAMYRTVSYPNTSMGHLTNTKSNTTAAVRCIKNN
jgi:uncharacterized protein (TIGR02145 family)